MIAFAEVNEYIKPSELQFLENVAHNLGVNQEAFTALLHKKEKRRVLKTEGERLVQFHRLLLLMNVDNKITLHELKRLHNIGVQMGLSPSAIDTVISVMNQYPNRMIPVDRIISIFKSHYN